MVGEVHPVDHEPDQVQPRQVRAHQVAKRHLGGLANRRETADLLVEADSPSTCPPTGSNPTW